MKSLKVSSAILCDYVAPGANNKHVIVNAIAGNVIVPSLPAELHFGIYIELVIQEGQGPHSNLEAFLDGEKLFEVTGVAGGDFRPGNQSVLSLTQFAFKLDSEKTLEAYVSTEGFKRTLVLKRRISLARVPSASLLPAEQSQPAAQETSSQP